MYLCVCVCLCVRTRNDALIYINDGGVDGEGPSEDIFSLVELLIGGDTHRLDVDGNVGAVEGCVCVYVCVLDKGGDNKYGRWMATFGEDKELVYVCVPVHDSCV